jgi:predicted O-methyltransferase YrrM
MRLDHLMWDENGWGYLPATDEIFTILQETIDIVDPRSLLEIGFYAGHSTTYWAEMLEKDIQIVSCYPDNHPRGDEFGPVIESLYSNVKVICKASPEIVTEFSKRKFDLVYIDGNHAYSNAYNDTLAAFVVDADYIMYDNTELNEVRQCVNKFVSTGYYTIAKEFEYLSTFKGVSQTNRMTLVKVDK